MKRCAKKLVEKNGMTLVELVAALFMMVMLTVAITLVVGPTLRDYARARELADVSGIVSNVSDRIMSELTLLGHNESVAISADGASLTFEQYGGYAVQLGFADGILFKDGKPVYDRAFYKGNTVSGVFDFDKTSGVFTVKFAVEGMRTDVESYFIDRVFCVRPVINS